MAEADQQGTRAQRSPPRVALVGSVGVGKTTLFEQLCSDARRGKTLQLPGTSQRVAVGTLRAGLLAGGKGEALLLDTPGVHSVFSQNEDERVIRKLLLTLAVDSLLVVLDAKNLRRSLVLALELAEFGLPMRFVLNMVDEAENRGIEISARELSRRLGAPVVAAVANERQGVDDIPAALSRPTNQRLEVDFPPAAERMLERLAEVADNGEIPARALGILLCGGCADARRHVARSRGKAALREVEPLVAELGRELGRPADVVLTECYSAEAEKIVAQVQRMNRQSPRLLARFGRWSQRPLTGIPIALAVLVSLYYWVGAFGATWLVDLLNGQLFGKVVIPALTRIVEPIPSRFLRAALVDPDFGVLTTGLFLAFGIVLPVLFCFYLFFGILEESGYLPRVSVLLNRALQRVGLNGKGIMPLVMGLSCVTVAILTTRMLDTRRERIIATFLLTLALPCAPLVGVMMIVLGRMPWFASVFVFGFLLVQTVIAGLLAARIVPGSRAEFIMELPPMRIPKPIGVLRKTWRRTFLFMKEAVPLFLLAAFLVFLFDYAGGLRVLEEATRPLMGGLLGLPDESVRVFMKTMIRRETGAVELDHLRGAFTPLQLVVTLLVMTFLIPCVNTVIVVFKEHGLKVGLLILSAVFAYALLLGGIANHGCRLLGIDFEAS